MRKAFGLLAGLTALAACATIIHGSGEDVGISSQPVGATVTIDNKPEGTTPVVAHLSRKDNHIIKIELDGYQPFAMTTTRSTSGWIWGNIVFGGLIGLAVDAISGGLYNVNPDHVDATLAKQVGARHGANGQLTIQVVLRPDPSWQRIGTLQRR